MDSNNEDSIVSTVPTDPVERRLNQVKVQEDENHSIISVQGLESHSPPEFLHLYSALETSVFELDAASSIAYNGLAQDGLSQERPFVLGVTSSVPGEGKTTTATHLALTMAMNSYKRICIMDFSLAEVAYDDVAERLGLFKGQSDDESIDRTGIVDVLEEKAESIPTYQLTEPSNLTVVPRGKSSDRPAKICRSPKIQQLISSARHAFDVIIVDLPAVSTENALPLSKHCDGVLLVIQAGTTPKDIVQRAITMIGRDRIVGVALNRERSSIPSWLAKILRL